MSYIQGYYSVVRILQIPMSLNIPTINQFLGRIKSPPNDKEKVPALPSRLVAGLLIAVHSQGGRTLASSSDPEQWLVQE